MSIQIISEIHTEAFPYIPKHAEILAIAGNIGSVEKAGYEEFIADVTSKFNTVLLVPGNEESYYSQTLSMEEIKLKLDALAQKHSNLVILNNSTKVINGVTFIGSTLWPGVCKENASQVLIDCPDFQNILLSSSQSTSSQSTNSQSTTSGHHAMTIRDFNHLNTSDITFLSNEIMRAKSNNGHSKNNNNNDSGKVVVISHFPPSGNGTFDPSGLSAPLKQIQFIDLEHLLGPHVDLWIFGHTTKVCSIATPYNTKLVSNPHSSPSYSPEKHVIDLSSSTPNNTGNGNSATNKKKNPNNNNRNQNNNNNNNNNNLQTIEEEEDKTAKLMDFLMNKKPDPKTESAKRKYFQTENEGKLEVEKENNSRKVAEKSHSGLTNNLEEDEDELESSFLKNSKPTLDSAPVLTPSTQPPLKKQKDFKF